MSDTITAFVVVLEEGIGEEEAEKLQSAISQLRHVLSVKPHVQEMAEHIAREQIRMELSNKLFKVIYGKKL